VQITIKGAKKPLLLTSTKYRFQKLMLSCLYPTKKFQPSVKWCKKCHLDIYLLLLKQLHRIFLVPTRKWNTNNERIIYNYIFYKYTIICHVQVGFYYIYHHLWVTSSVKYVTKLGGLSQNGEFYNKCYTVFIFW